MALVKKKVGSMSPKKSLKKKDKEEAAPTELTLPTSLSVPMAELGDYSWLLFGVKKIGKTNLSAEFPAAFHMMTEPGGKAMAIHQRPVSNWRDFRTYVKLLQTDKKFKTQVVDTADLLYDYCTDYVCRKMGIEHPSDEAYGKGWKAVRSEFTREISKLMNNGKGTIFISHSKEMEIKQRKGGSYHSIQPTLGGQARDILEGIVDIFAYFDYDGNQRVLTVRGDETVAAGSRLRNHFLWNGREVPSINMGRNAAEGYANLVKCFNNEYPWTPPVDDAEDKPVVKKKLKVKR